MITKTYFAIRSYKTYRGKSALSIFRITEDNLIPQWIGFLTYDRGLSRGEETEMVQYLVDNNIEQIDGWNDKGKTRYAIQGDKSISSDAEHFGSDKLGFNIKFLSYSFEIK